MIFKTLTIFGGLVLVAMSGSLCADEGKWTKDVNGLQARLVMVEKPKRHGTRWLVPYLELRNVRNFPNAMNALDIDISVKRLKLEVVDAQGKPLPEQSAMRSGPAAALTNVILPYDSFMRISLEGKGWGISPNAPAVMATDGDIWHLTHAHKGRVFLRATLTGRKGQPEWKVWTGELQIPQVRVNWDVKQK